MLLDFIVIDIRQGTCYDWNICGTGKIKSIKTTYSKKSDLNYLYTY